MSCAGFLRGLIIITDVFSFNNNFCLGILCIAHQNIDYNRVIKTVYVCLHSSLITRGSVLFRGTMVSAQGRDTMCGCPSVKKKQNMSGL